MTIKDLIERSLDDSTETFEFSTELFYIKGLHWLLVIMKTLGLSTFNTLTLKIEDQNSYIDWEDQESLIQFEHLLSTRL